MLNFVQKGCGHWPAALTKTQIVKVKVLNTSKRLVKCLFFWCAPFGYLYFRQFSCMFCVIASIANIHPVYGAGVRTHDHLVMSRLPLPLEHGSRLKKRLVYHYHTLLILDNIKQQLQFLNFPPPLAWPPEIFYQLGIFYTVASFHSRRKLAFL